MLATAQELVYTLKDLMPTRYQKDNLEAMLGLFLEAQGHPLPEQSRTLAPDKQFVNDDDNKLIDNKAKNKRKFVNFTSLFFLPPSSALKRVSTGFTKS